LAIVSPKFTRAAFAGVLIEDSYNSPHYNGMDTFILRKPA